MSHRGDDGRMSRRDALKWIAASMATVAFLDTKSFGATAKGFGFDPNLLEPEVTWPRTLSQEQLRTVAALCDLIIPADEHSPSASQVGVPDFIDEWISAPYENQESDRRIVLRGLAWLDEESHNRFDRNFADLNEKQMSEIADTICYLPDAPAELHDAAVFFAKFRNLTAGGFYTTPKGRKDVGYVGNTPLPRFDGPPLEVLQHLGLA